MKAANRASGFYQEGDRHWTASRMREALGCFLAAARLGHVAAYLVVAQFYDGGDGTRRDEGRALDWYRRAYRGGDSKAANNIGCILCDQGKTQLALKWFDRAIERGDVEANLNAGLIYLREKGDAARAAVYFRRVALARGATEGSREDAGELIAEAARIGGAGAARLRRQPGKGKASTRGMH